jgi:hypothetical protein
MTRIAAYLIACCGALSASGAQGGDISLTITASELVVQRGHQLRIEATISNSGSTPIRLVCPGDGSEIGWRPPIVKWAFVPADGKSLYTEKPPLELGRFCGNINPLKVSEFFTLQPGQKRDISEWISPLVDVPAGRYRVVMHYTNDPTHTSLGGVPLGPNEPGVEDLIKQSTGCKLISNEILVTVVE